MKTISYLTLLAMFTMSTAMGAKKDPVKSGDPGLPATNPFYAPSMLPMQAPAFDKIKNSDFKPAIEEGIRQHAAEIEQIADNPTAPTFENTIVAMEKSGQLLSRVSMVFSVLTGANTNAELQKTEAEVAPQLAANNDAIYLNSNLFKRVEAIYQKRNQLKLDAESNRLLEIYYQNFVLAGARLSDADKETLKKLNQEEASLRTQFGRQLLGGTRAGAVIFDETAFLKV